MSAVDERVFEEVEALEAILMDDVIVKRVNEVPEIIEYTVHPSTGDNVERRYVCVTLEVKLVPGYPETMPEIILRNPRGLDDETLNTIHSELKRKLDDCIGQPVVFELIESIRDHLDRCNLPTGQCAICLFSFNDCDAFIKTQCYHHFHCHCLALHLIAGKKNHQEEMEKLPNWQQMEAPPYQDICPVCRSPITCDLEALQKAPPPEASKNEPPFQMTPELKALQLKMQALLAHQIARGGVVGMGDNGPPPLTITTPEDHNEATNGSSSSQHVKPEGMSSGLPAGNASNGAASPGSPQARGTRVPYRGFNRRGKPGRRGRGGR